MSSVKLQKSLSTLFLFLEDHDLGLQRRECLKLLHPENGSCKILRNVGIQPHHYTISQPRRSRHDPSSALNFKVALGYGLVDRRFEARQGLGTFLFTTAASRPALGPASYPMGTRGSIPVSNAALTTHLHLMPGSKNAWSYTSTPPVRLHGVAIS